MVRWGILGCGWVARDYAGPAIRASSNGVLVGAFDPGADARRTAEAALGVPCHTEAAPLLGEVDAVYVAAPNHAHRGLVEQAAAAGCHVLCEKPMATTLADARAMVAACEQAGVRYATAFDQRFHAAHRALAELVANGRLGTVTALRIVYACWLPPSWSPGAVQHDNWRIDPARAGGGALMDLAPHGLDLASVVLGERIVEIAAMGQHRVHRYKVEDGATLMGRTEAGTLLQLHVAYNHPETLPRRRLEVVGTGGLAVLTDTMGQVGGGTLDLLDAATGVATRMDVPGVERSPFLNQAEAFAAAVSGGAPFPFDPAHDLHIMDLVLRAQAMADPGLHDAA